MTLPWSKEQTMMLIELYRNHPCLWNVKLTDYTVETDKRAAALKSLAEEMKEERNLTTNEVKKKD